MWADYSAEVDAWPGARDHDRLGYRRSRTTRKGARNQWAGRPVPAENGSGVLNGLWAVHCAEETTMTLAYRIATLTMALALMLGGPLAPLARAQSAAQTPDVFKETMKAPDAVSEPDVTFNETYYEISAGIMTAFLVPGRALTCFASGVLGTVVLMATLGTAYKAASGVLNEGCGGKWIVRAEDLVPDKPGTPPPTAEKK